MLQELVWHMICIDVGTRAVERRDVEGKVVEMLVSWPCNRQIVYIMTVSVCSFMND